MTALQGIQNTVNNSLFSAGVGVNELAFAEMPDGRISVSLTPEGITQRMSSLVAQSIEVIRSRIDELGTTEPTIQRQGDTRVMVQKGIILSPEGRQVVPRFSVEDNLRMGAYTRPDQEIPETMEQVFQLFPKLRDRRKQIAGTLSGGEQQMLAVGRAMMAKPRLLLLDEPSLGLAPLVIKEIFDMIDKIRDMGTTILLVEQNARVALRHSDRAYVLETGRIVLSDTAQALLNSDMVRKAYLGGL